MIAVDAGTLQGLGTVVALSAFVGVTVWAYSKGKKADFDEAAQLPFADEPAALPSESEEQETKRRDRS